MNNYTTGWISNCKAVIIKGLIAPPLLSVLIVCLLFGMAPAETRWTPSLGLTGIHDDNIRFSRNQTVDDYIYYLEPGIKYDYNQELTRISANGRAVVRRYQDNDDLDDELYRMTLKGDSNVTERMNLKGSYEFIKDTTLESELDETGRIYTRDDRMSHKVMMGPSIQLTERTTIGVVARYRDVAYDSDAFVDYKTWEADLPIRWHLETQIDTIFISPGYVDRDSDTNHSTSYNLSLGWDHESTERLTLKFFAGARYTEIERKATNESEENWNAIGGLQLNYDFETSNIVLDFQRNLKTTADGNQANVTRMIARLRWHLTERFGTEIRGGYYLTETEGVNTDNTTEHMKAGAELFYNLTENHNIFAAYDYSQHYQKDIPVDPRAERNRILAGIRLNFPVQ